MAGTRLVPYRLPELLAARAAANGTPPRAFLLEGEKDADALCRWNLTASCNPMGALKWKPEFNQHFAGFDIVILPDNDTVGERHGEQIAAQLAPIAASVRILKLHGLPEGGDVSDWISNGGTRKRPRRPDRRHSALSSRMIRPSAASGSRSCASPTSR